jgi:hypothetical protein
MPNRHLTLPVLLVALGLLGAGCRYQDLNAAGTLGAAPFSDLKCFERGNPEGFSFEVPACECQAGMRLRYVARTDVEPPDIHFEFETNFRDEDPTDDVRMVSSSSDALERLFIGARELPAPDAASPIDRVQWDLAREMWDSMFRNYAPVMRRAFMTCTEDRLERQARQRRRAAR